MSAIFKGLETALFSECHDDHFTSLSPESHLGTQQWGRLGQEMWRGDPAQGGVEETEMGFRQGAPPPRRRGSQSTAAGISHDHAFLKFDSHSMMFRPCT